MTNGKPFDLFYLKIRITLLVQGVDPAQPGVTHVQPRVLHGHVAAAGGARLVLQDVLHLQPLHYLALHGAHIDVDHVGLSRPGDQPYLASQGGSC